VRTIYGANILSYGRRSPLSPDVQMTILALSDLPLVVHFQIHRLVALR
jgi:hypothetical protein